MPYSTSARKLEPRKTVSPKTKPTPRLKVVQGKGKKRGFSVSFQGVLIFLTFVAAICFLVYNQVCLTEVTAEINTLNREMKVLESEYIRLQSSLEPTESMRVVAQRAEQELGMQRLDDYNITQVTIYQEDKVEVALSEKPKSLTEHVEAVVGLLAKKVDELSDSQ